MVITNQELIFQNNEKERRAAELVIANNEKERRAAELVIANNEKERRAAELIIANNEKEKRAAELATANNEKEKRAAELAIANNEKEKRAAELVIANNEKEKRAAELIIANNEKEKRAAELVIALEFRIAATVFESQEGMMITDANEIILRVNNAFTTITGYNAEEAIGEKLSMLSSGRQAKIFYDEMWKAINTDNYWAGEVWDKGYGK